MHAEGRFRRTPLKLICCETTTYIGMELSYQTEKPGSQCFSYFGRKIQPRITKILRTLGASSRPCPNRYFPVENAICNELLSALSWAAWMSADGIRGWRLLQNLTLAWCGPAAFLSLPDEPNSSLR